MAGEQRLQRRSLLTVACLVTPLGRIRKTSLKTHFITSKELMKRSQTELDWSCCSLQGLQGYFVDGMPTALAGWVKSNAGPLWWISEGSPGRWPVHKWTSTPQHPHSHTPLLPQKVGVQSHIFHSSTLLQRKRSSKLLRREPRLDFSGSVRSWGSPEKAVYPQQRSPQPVLFTDNIHWPTETTIRSSDHPVPRGGGYQLYMDRNQYSAGVNVRGIKRQTGNE